MTKTERIVTEYSQVEMTDWWALYKDKIAEYRKSRGEILETCGEDEVKGFQGEIRALKFIAGLPDRILSELANESK